MRDAAEAGADSLLIADVPALEAEPFAREMEQAGIEPVLIAAANTPDATLGAHRQLSKAYTYCVSRAGITGTHAGGEFDAALVDAARRRRRAAAGFRLRHLRRPSMSAPRSTPARRASFAARRSSISPRDGGDVAALGRIAEGGDTERLAAAMN